MSYAPLDHDYSAIQCELSIIPLENRRDIADVMFLHKIINNAINSPYLLPCVRFRVPPGMLTFFFRGFVELLGAIMTLLIGFFVLVTPYRVI